MQVVVFAATFFWQAGFKHRAISSYPITISLVLNQYQNFNPRSELRPTGG